MVNRGKSAKRKRNVLNANAAQLTELVSQLSISQSCSKKKKMKKKRPKNSSMNMSNKEAFSFASTSLPQYLTVPDRVFKQMLSRAVEGGEKLVQWIDTEDKLESIRRLAHLINLSRYL